jgi:hypothetical protein
MRAAGKQLLCKMQKVDDGQLVYVQKGKERRKRLPEITREKIAAGQIRSFGFQATRSLTAA